MNTAAKAKLVRVRVVGAVVWHDGRPHYTGHELDVSEADARALEQAESAERVVKRARRRRQ